MIDPEEPRRRHEELLRGRPGRERRPLLSPARLVEELAPAELGLQRDTDRYDVVVTGGANNLRHRQTANTESRSGQ